MPKLSDTQLIVLSHAAQRDDRGIATIPDRAAVAKLLRTNLLATIRKTPDLALWETAKDGTLLGLVITDAGLEAIGHEVSGDANAKVVAQRLKARPAKKTMKRSTTKHPSKSTKGKPAPSVRAGSKLDAVIGLLRRPKGARLEELMKATGWQAHSVRGAISGALKSKQGLTVTSERVGDARIYRIPV